MGFAQPGFALVLPLLLMVAGCDCGVPGADAGSDDAGEDAGAPDAGTPDAGTPDAGTPDAGAPDAGTPDAGAHDAGAPDAGGWDAGDGVWPLYPVNGTRWMDLVQAGAGDQPCRLGSAWETSIDSCVHAGELRVWSSSAFPDCASASARDSLLAFDWVCQPSDGGVRFVSTGLKRDAGLATLIEFFADGGRFKPNQVTASRGGIEVTSASTVWWPNPIRSADSVAMAALSAFDAGPNGNLIWTVQSPAAPGDLRVAHGMSVVVRPGDTIDAGNVESWGPAWLEGSFRSSPTRAMGPFAHLRHLSGVTGTSHCVVDPGVRGLDIDFQMFCELYGNSVFDGARLPRGGRALNQTLFPLKLRNVVVDGGFTLQGKEIQLVHALIRGGQLRSVEDAVLHDVAVIGSAGLPAFDVGYGTVIATDVHIEDSLVALAFAPTDGVLLGATTVRQNWVGMFAPTGSPALLHVSSLNNLGFGIAPYGSTVVAAWVANNETGFGDYFGRFHAEDLVATRNDKDVAIGGTDGGGTFTGALVVTQPSTSCQSVAMPYPQRGLDDQCLSAGPSTATTTSASLDGVFSSWPGPRGPCDAGPCAFDPVPFADAGAALLNRYATPGTPRSFRFPPGLYDGGCASGALVPDAGRCELFYLPHATELFDDDSGNDNGLCESNERCRLNPNIGAYPGHGPLLDAGPYSAPPVTNVHLFRHALNGR